MVAMEDVTEEEEVVDKVTKKFLGRQNSTLGSVVPLAMFIIDHSQPLFYYSVPQNSHSQAGSTTLITETQYFHNILIPSICEGEGCINLELMFVVFVRRRKMCFIYSD